MKQLQFYKYATWGLLLLNIAAVIFFFFRKPPPPHRADGPKRAIDILGFDQGQHRLFLASANAHGLKMDTIQSQQQALLLPYFQSITSSFMPTNKETILSQVEALERDKITTTYQHFQDIKNILGEGKDAEFELFIERILNRILKKQGQKPHPPRKPAK